MAKTNSARHEDPKTGLLSDKYVSELRGRFGMGPPEHAVEVAIKTLDGMTAGQLRQVRDANIWQLSRPAAMALEGGLSKEAISASLQRAMRVTNDAIQGRYDHREKAADWVQRQVSDGSAMRESRAPRPEQNQAPQQNATNRPRQPRQS